MNFADRIIEEVLVKKSHVCVGLDPRWQRIPRSLRKNYGGSRPDTAEAARQVIEAFNEGLLEAVKDTAVAVKPQIAFYEIYGEKGIEAFWNTVKIAQNKGLLVIGDVKRNDIGSTAAAYSRAYLENSSPVRDNDRVLPDAITINPYFGSDGIEPFLQSCEKNDRGVFILVRTSNPSAAEVQDQKLVDGATVGEKIAGMVAEWGDSLKGENGYSPVGAVVGASCREEAAELRARMSSSYFLVPGYGAQGGGVEDVIPCFDYEGLGALVNSSRGIDYAYEKDEYSDDYRRAAKKAVQDMSEKINSALAEDPGLAWEEAE
ncbi:orotidine-5'-phosphate decarboxylase [Halarsenatibacter silvermanii]|uniref:Orotidine 5'-phosphate decarboxylase n=1 Tax=Halarsenatibacter silvermanii TaxID=321763 RepID=A0A1G9PVP9_9FIRM|nr:orotidine-5'-phosphate decarboxylase [Halarsenatibacter silvermanii]SDM02185.1 orotidine-5'-phosphate decarboxylase [Halarsenatibacter silvermanii]